MPVKQPNISIINVHNFNSHLNPENTVINKDYTEKYSNKTPRPIFFQGEQDILLSQSKYTITSFIDFRPYKNIFSNLLTYAGNLQQELNKYTNVKSYNPFKGRTITPEERRRINSVHSILLECSAEVELIANIIHQESDF